MTRVTPVPLSLMAVAALAAGCAGAPAASNKPAASTSSPCSRLDVEIADTEEARRAALEKEKGAWKAVVPFAVAARYASGKSAADQADRQLDKLHADFHRQGCDRHGN